MKRFRRFTLGSAAAGALALAAATPALANQSSSVDDLSKLSIEELANVQITSVSKRPERLARAPAAVYVITGEDVRRSAAVSLPEALRLAPNLNVVRVNSNNYAISARGFNGYETSNKLLVMVDGRSIYSPFHSGVLWDANQVMLDDLERVEVVSGPGGTLWGANAVNGVINVISKTAADTQGLLVRMQGGDLDKDGAIRFGGRAGDGAYWRVYAMGFDRRDTLLPSGAEAADGWGGGQTGFRVDGDSRLGTFTVQGDAYYNRTDAGGRVRGGNVVGRWTRDMAGGTLAVQAYYDRADRYTPPQPSVDESVKTWDLQVQHTLPLGRHLVVWGGGYRVIDDQFVIGQIIDPVSGTALPYLSIDPNNRRLKLANLFVQDEVRLTDDLTLTLGLKAEDSSYSGLEYMPNVRLAWRPGDNALVWAAASRAVRTPSRVERDLIWTGIIAGGYFESESVTAYEAGYRTQMFGRASLSISAFFNRYDDLRTNEYDPVSGGFPVHVGNGRVGDTWGVEAWGGYDVTQNWRLSAGLAELRKDFHLKDGVIDLANPVSTGNDPEHQFLLRSQSQLGDRVDLDLMVRAVDDLPKPAVDAYVELDARLGVQLTDEAEFFVAGTNLLDDQRREGGDPDFVNEVRRSVYAGLRWRF